MHLLLEQQQRMQSMATELLETVIKPIVEPFGELEIGGSYLYSLMHQPDIDLGITNNDLSKQLYVDLCSAFLASEFVSGIKTADRVNFPHKHGSDRPTGYWVSPIIKFQDIEWSCDIWLQKPEWSNGTHSRFQEPLSNLTDEQRILILSLKQDLLAAARYGVGKDFESADVYDAVLSNHFQDKAETRAFFGLPN